LANDLGIAKVADVARRLGVTGRLPLVPSLALGAADVSPLDMARAYATIAAGGIRPDIQTIEDLVNVAGQTLERRKLRFEQVLDPGSAFLITSMLNGVAKRGTASRVYETGMTGPIAAKTGTSDSERDLWFIGFTPELVAVVWLGFDEPQSLGIPSSVGALPVWRQFVQEVTGGRIRGEFRPPEEVEIVEIDPATGAQALDGCPRRKREYFLVGTAPVTMCPAGAEPPTLEGERRETDRGFVEWLRRHF
jgi:membrane carboxypeptidase/penicillin-binding protein